MPRLLAALLLLPLLLRATPLEKWEAVAKPWDRSLGSHRVVVKAPAAPAVRAHIEWRRPDRDPEKKAVLVYDLATGKEVSNVLAQNITGDFGDVTFQPVSGAGEYAVYFLPVKVEGGAFPVSRYLPPQNKADQEWAKQAVSPPAAEVVRWEAISAHDAWTEMEIMATDAEAQKLVAAWRGVPVIVPGYRQSIRSMEKLPASLIQSSMLYDGQNLPRKIRGTRGEVLSFQIVLWPADRDLTNVRAAFGPFGASSMIKPGSIACLNTKRVDWNGREYDVPLNIPKGRVQPLWFTVDLSGEGVGPGVFHLSLTDANGWKSDTEFLVEFDLRGPEVKDHGDADPQSLSRLRWLNSTTAVDNEPAKGYSSLKVSGRTISCLGRELELGEDGLPLQIRSYFNKAVTKVMDKPTLELLQGGMEFVLHPERTADMLSLKGSGLTFTKQEPGIVEWKSTVQSAGVKAFLKGSMEFDGSVHYRISLEAPDAAVPVGRAGLIVSRNKASTPYILGLQQETGLTPAQLKWKWDVANKNQDSVWLGAVNGGLRIQLKAENYIRPSVNIHYKRRPLNDPPSWNAGGQGSIEFFQALNGQQSLPCLSGPFTLEPGKPLHFDFDLLITPFHTLRTKEQWADRYYHTGGVPTDYQKYLDSAKSAGATVVNLHQGHWLNPYINYPFLTWEKLRDFSKAAHDRGIRAKYYYTVRELSNWCPELFAFRSMGDEILMSGKGGGHPWGEEHLGGNYWQAWYEPAVQDVSFLTQPMSRFHNYYIEGLRWLCENAGCDGIYLDDIAYDRSIMLRARKVLDRYCPRGGLIDLHSWNEFHDGGAWAHCANIFMDSLPFVDRMWFGEGHHYSGPPPEHFLVEISGVPFGLMGEMLEGGGNPWLGLVFGCTGRLGWGGNPRSVWKLWDDFGVQESEFIGWWAGDENPVQPSLPDVKATVWKKSGSTLLALANFSKEAKQSALTIDWKALGLDPAKAKFYAPAIPDLRQREALFAPDKPVLLKPYSGVVFIIDEKEHALSAAPALAGPGEVLIDEDFSRGLDKAWKPVLSPKAESGARVDAGYVFQVPANVHAYLERELPDNTGAVSARIWQDGKDQGQQWGPGIALIWPDGKTLRAAIRQDGRLSVAANGQDDMSSSITARAPVEFRIQWDKDNIHIIAGGPAMGDLEEEIAAFPRTRFPGAPSLLRAGKMPNNASPRDFSEPGPAGFNRIERIRIHKAS